MKGPRELKRYMAIKRKNEGKPNGVIPGFFMDDLRLFKLERCKKYRNTRRQPRDGYAA